MADFGFSPTPFRPIPNIGLAAGISSLGDSAAGGITKYRDDKDFANAIANAKDANGNTDWNKVATNLLSSGHPTEAALAGKLYSDVNNKGGLFGNVYWDQQGNAFAVDRQKGLVPLSQSGQEGGGGIQPPVKPVSLGDREKYVGPGAVPYGATDTKAGAPPPGYAPTTPTVTPGQPIEYQGQVGTPTAMSAPGPAKQRLSSGLGNLTQVYQKLDEIGGIANPDRSVAQNIVPAIANSTLGQEVTGRLGTQAGSLRNRIATIRPQLINAVRQATGMSARQMDSNVELNFYLQQATDPSKDIYTNYAAIDALDKAYGLGNTLQTKLSPQVYQKVLKAREDLAGKAPQSDQPIGDTSGAPQAAPQQKIIAKGSPEEAQAFQQARDAIAAGAPQDQVLKRLQEMGIQQ